MSMDIPVPSLFYRNSIATNAIMLYQNVMTHYIPRILARLTKYNLLNWLLTTLGIRYEWLLMLLVVIL
jgi:hypothetical protein